MGRPRKIVNTEKVTFNLPQELKTRLEYMKLQRRGKVSMNDLFVAAVRAYISPEEQRKHEAAVARRLDRIDRRLGKLELTDEIISETLAQYIRTYLATTQEVHEDQRAAAKAQGSRRWNAFVYNLTKKLGDHRSLFTELPDELFRPYETYIFKPEDFVPLPSDSQDQEENNGSRPADLGLKSPETPVK